MPLLLAAGLIGVAAMAAATWPAFDARTVEVIGNRRVPTSEILRRAGVAPHRSIWLQNTGAMARRIDEIPYIARVSVHRIPPSEIRIRVAERVPFAVLWSGANAAVVDASLRVLEPATGLEAEPAFFVPPGLALVPGSFVEAGAPLQLRDAYDAMTIRNIEPRTLEFDRYGGIVAGLPDGLRILLGQPDDVARKLALVHAILVQVVHGQRRVATIDVRAPGTPVVVYR